MMTYLAGAMEHAPDNGSAWRAEMSEFVRQELGHRVYNPVVEEFQLLTPDEIRHFHTWKSTDMPRFRETIRKIIEKDLSMILEEADYIICLWDVYAQRGSGTHGELTFAFHHGIPVYMISEIPVEQMSSWLVGCTTELFHEYHELHDFLRKTYRR